MIYTIQKNDFKSFFYALLEQGKELINFFFSNEKERYYPHFKNINAVQHKANKTTTDGFSASECTGKKG